MGYDEQQLWRREIDVYLLLRLRFLVKRAAVRKERLCIACPTIYAGSSDGSFGPHRQELEVLAAENWVSTTTIP